VEKRIVTQYCFSVRRTAGGPGKRNATDKSAMGGKAILEGVGEVRGESEKGSFLKALKIKEKSGKSDKTGMKIRKEIKIKREGEIL
jgi:hypothetical protein